MTDDAILSELKAIREMLECTFELVSASVGVEVAAPEMHFHVEDVYSAYRKWQERNHRGDTFGRFLTREIARGVEGTQIQALARSLRTPEA